MAKKAKKVFDLKVFLASVNGGRTIVSYRKGEVIFSQGDPANAAWFREDCKDELQLSSSLFWSPLETIHSPGLCRGIGCARQ
jgi:CRP/FNR family cyclic AMP-dependent transcriptional regulator